MQVKTVAVFMLYLFVSVALPCSGFADEGKAQGTELKQLEQQILELKRQMDEMRQKHEAEINALIEKVKTLQQAPAVPKQAEAEDELSKLRKMAESLAGEKKEPEKPPEETVYKFRGLNLQQLNPEISVGGDLIAYFRDQDGTRQHSDAFLRGLELNFQSYLDPFSKLKGTAHIHDDGDVHLEEAYYTHFTLIEGATLDLGRFRQQFGIVNRWHEDALDQVQYPLALQRIFGEEGLNQTGASVEWAFPEWAGAHHGLTFQVTNTENERLFDGDTLGTPSVLFHYKNYRDLSRDTYLEFGLSGLWGWNDEWDIQTAPDTVVTKHDALSTWVFGADVSVLWEPAERSLYRNIEWRSELYALNRDILAPDGSRDTINAWGAYSYIQSKIAQNLILGVRGDYYEPDSKDYAFGTLADEDHSMHVPLAYAAKDPYRWQVGPYITWWQSEWVLFRAEYDYAWGDGTENDEHVLWFQTVFAAGPHKHERY
jgi:hypothetical protein